MLGLRNNVTPPHADCLQTQLPEVLLKQHHSQLQAIQQLAGVPKAHWFKFYLNALLSLADYVQHLPASEAHHHCEAGGLLTHTLEVVIHAMRIRRGHLLPQGSDAEEIIAQKDVWTYAIFSAALLHDIGKPVTDMVVRLYDKQGRDTGTWNPLTSPIRNTYWYRPTYRRERQHRSHEKVTLLLAPQVLPSAALDWLAQDRKLLPMWLAAVSGIHEDSGIIGELVQQADRRSVAANLGAITPGKRLSSARIPLHERLLTGLRFLLKDNQLPLNRNGAAAWFDGKYLWLVSKRGVDSLREHLTMEGHSGIPTRNDRIFDELQQNNVLVANGDRSIWRVNISDEGWSHTLTCLCFAAEKIWPVPSSRPEVFGGRISPDNSNGDTTDESSISGVEENHSLDESLPTNLTPIESDPAAFFPAEPNTEFSADTEHTEESENRSSALDDADDAGQAFRAWLQDGLVKDKFETNSVNARIHTVPEGLLLVSPGIFKDFDQSNWQQAQKRFQKLKLHRKTAQGTNIYTYQVTGKRNKSRIKGFLIDNPESVFGGVKFPSANPHLELLGN